MASMVVWEERLGKLLAVRLRQAWWRLADEQCELQEEEMEFHRHELGGNQCTSFVAKHVRDPLQTISDVGEQGLINYTSILIVHSEVRDRQPRTLVIESFVVDVPEGNTKDDICYFVKNLLRCNLRTVADVSEKRLASP
ncbi:hypothetical protein E2562_007848 [Oryza meyeriana var. granulata]|uniref:Uncharacterized protein n=1 Tax=Oryza meyeriana var. granulata TaxID=110450 RepID=A0A6G1F5A5_9ORYZ|nr:hypothetical protein E2562_007848 [Oryza meyeriana var. granulata]